METAIGIIGLLSLGVSIPLLVATIGVRQTIRKELEDWTRELYRSKERRTAEHAFFGQMMDTNARLHHQARITEKKYSDTVDQVNEALKQQMMIVKNAVDHISDPKNNPAN